MAGIGSSSFAKLFSAAEMFWKYDLVSLVIFRWNNIATPTAEHLQLCSWPEIQTFQLFMPF